MTKRTRRLLFSVFVFSFLSGCSQFQVAVKHPAPIQNPEIVRSLQNLYVLVDGPEGKVLQKAIQKIQESVGQFIDSESQKEGQFGWKVSLELFAELLAREFSGSGVPLLGYQVGNQEEFKKFGDYFQPASFLYLRVNSLVVNKQQFKEEKNTKQGDKVVKSTLTYWKVAGTLNFSYDLRSDKTNPDLAGRNFSVSVAERLNHENELEDWVEQNQKKLLQKAVQQICDQYLPPPVTAMRVLKNDKKDEGVKRGYEAAWKGEWKKAGKIWRKTAQTNPSVLAYHNLGVACEKNGDFPAALESYEKAQNLAREKSSSPIDDWEGITKELRTVVQTYKMAAVQNAAPSWFQKRVAILPFANESNFVDGPDWVEKHLSTKLEQKGYDVVPKEFAEVQLRNIGINDGGQLKAYQPQEIAKALESDLLVYGTILALNEIPLGIYFKREVEISFKIVDSSGKVLMEDQKKVLKQKLVKGEAAIAQGVFQLAQSLAQRITKSAFSKEIDEVLEQVFQTLPGR